MPTPPPDWTVLVFTTLAAGVLGSAISTYGGRASERRAVRAEVSRWLQRTEALARQHDTDEARAEFEASLDELQAACLLMGPRVYRLADLYCSVRMHRFGSRKIPPTRRTPPLSGVASQMAGFVAASLLAESIRHPWLSTVTRWRRIRKLRDYLRLVGEESSSDVTRNLYRHLIRWMDNADEWPPNLSTEPTNDG
jgi:hypothetical protein